MGFLQSTEHLPSGTGNALEGLATRLRRFLNVEHNDDGTHRLGLFTDVAYNAGIYQTEAAGITWTVSRVNQFTYQYTQIGKLVTIHVVVEGSSTAGGSTYLTMQLPNNFVAVNRQEWSMIYYDNGAAVVAGGASVANLGRKLLFYRLDGSTWPALTGTLWIRGTFQLRVQ